MPLSDAEQDTARTSDKKTEAIGLTSKGRLRSTLLEYVQKNSLCEPLNQLIRLHRTFNLKKKIFTTADANSSINSFHMP